jgi:hypothetical protein
MSRGKEILFSYYGWVAVSLAVISLILSIFGLIKSELLFGMIGGAVSFAHFTQKQKLEETNLFRQLFDGFNDRYNKMNERLGQIHSGDTSAQLLPSEEDKLIEYFNLCAEEFLYYRRGYIPSDVWFSWCNGMKWYYANPRIKALWDKELKLESFYGLEMPCLGSGRRGVQ